MQSILKLGLGLWLCLSAGNTFSQLVTTGSNSVSANALVNMIIGSGVTFSNATYTGKPVAAGTFNGSNSNIGINSGVIITSGHINVAPGPNNNAGATYSNNGPNIPELETLAQSTTFDGAILEFDFVPQSNQISFRYVFASEEYNEYVCSEFNDAFAFFITGPGSTGAENLAMVPGTNIPVTINTINNGSVGALGAATNSPCELGNAAYFVGNASNTVQYDGFTTVLTASRSVIPCQTYHIRLMIADGADDIFDSAVFLEENSFSSDVFEITVSTPSNDSTIIEGCTDATITFSRPQASNQPLTINFTLGGTAQSGIDYTPLGNSVTIPPNLASVTLNIQSISDNLNEPTETIIINATTACGNVPAIIQLRDKPVLDIAAPNAAVCSGQTQAVLSASASGGLAPYTYSWNTGSTSASISVSPAVTTTYSVTATDQCGNTGTAQPMVIVGATPTASIGAPPFICSGVDATINYTGTAPPSATYIWNFDSPASVTSGSDQGPYQVSWETSGLKTISLQVIQNGCSTNVVTAQVMVNPTPTAEMVVDPLVCAGQNATITYTGTGTDTGGYGWGFPGGVIITGGRRGPFEIRWDSVGVFGITLTVTENGCTSPGAEIFVTVQPTPSSDFTVESPVCVGEASTIAYDGDAASTATYNWNFSGGTILSGSGTGPFEVQWNSAGTKNVMLSVIENGCTSNITSHNVVVHGIPQASFSVGTPVCEGQSTNVNYTGSSGNNAQYAWNFGTATVVNGSGQGPYQVQWNTAGTYPVSLTVSRNGCTSPPFSAQVQVLPIPQAQFTLESPVCVGEASTIYANGNSSSGMQFTWDFNGGQVLSGMQAGPYEVYWQNAGTKTVTLTLTSAQGCPSLPLQQTIVVNPTPTAVFTAETPICLNETSTLTYTGSAGSNASFSWNLNGGTALNGGGAGPIEAQWATPGIKTIILQVEENGCVSLPHQQQVNVRPIPTGYFTVQSPVCAFENTSIAYAGNAQANAQFVWDFDNGNLVSGSGAGPLQIFWESAGSKSVSLYVTENGCTSIEEVEVVLVNPIPTASFNLSGPVCIGGTSEVVYMGDAFASAQFVWDFDDANVLSGTGNGPYVLEWNTLGAKTVTLYLTQAGCTTPPTSHSIDVFPIPDAFFTVDERVCTGSPVTLNYTGQAGLQGNYSWSVDGGIILSGSGQGPIEVMWNTPGNKTIGLQVVENGCVSPPENGTVEVVPYPTSDFVASPLVCEGLNSTVTFTGVAMPLADFDWDFGGATVISGSGAGPYAVTWQVPGPQVITLNISQWGCAAPESQVELNVAPSPVPNAGDDSGGCPGDTVALGGAYTPSYTYQWLPSTGLNNATIANPQLILTNTSGQLQMQSYEVITTLGNCSVRDTVNVMVETMPVATFEVPNGQCLNGNSFSFSAQGNYDSDATYSWEFESSTSVQQSSLSAPSGIAYNQAGVYSVRLRVNTWGCSSPEFVDSIEVYAMPQAQFAANVLEGCPPLTPIFNNTSQGNGPLSFLWDMGDGHQYSQLNPQHSFESPGQHTVSLTVTSAEGCSTRYDAHALVNVYPVPTAGFTVNPQTLGTAHPLASVHDNSIGATYWEYNLGDGTAQTVPDFTHNYLFAGEYRITQVVTNDLGCKDYAEYQLKVEEEMTFYLPNAFTPNEDGDNEIFKCYGLNINEFRMEIYDRWGELVYLSRDIDEGWNGRLFNSMEQPVSQMDVYAVVVYVRDTQDPKIRRVDHRVTLVK